MSLSNQNKPSIRAYIGATGSGKGVSIRQFLKEANPARLLVWDPLGEYGEFVHVVGSTQELVQRLKAAGKGGFRLGLYPGMDAKQFAPKFDLFCRIAFSVGNLTLLVEELSDVTGPSYAPPSWGRISRAGRHAGLQVVAATQRPALVDKTFFGNCTYIRCFSLRYEEDCAVMARALRVPLADVLALETVEGEGATTIMYIEKDFRQKAAPANQQTITLTR